MAFSRKFWLVSFAVTLWALQANAQVDSNFYCFLCFGQSNMAGGGAGNQNDKAGLLTSDCDTNSRIKVLGFNNCATSDYSLGCTYRPKRSDTMWYTAFQPIQICSEGLSPALYFARTLLDSLRPDIKIGLIPCALSGQALEVFIKGQSGFNIPTYAHPTLGNSSPYDWMLKRCQAAQKVGVIKGAIFHQGESGAGSTHTKLAWIPLAKMIFDTIKMDLGVTDTFPNRFPFVVGELRQENTPNNPCCASFNKNIDSLAKVFPGCGLASSKGLAGNGSDPYHFNCAGMREIGKRYAMAMLAMCGPSYLPRATTSRVAQERARTYQAMQSATSSIKVFSVNGRVVRSYSGADLEATLHHMGPTGVFIVSRTLKDGRTVTLPYVAIDQKAGR